MISFNTYSPVLTLFPIGISRYYDSAPVMSSIVLFPSKPTKKKLIPFLFDFTLQYMPVSTYSEKNHYGVISIWAVWSSSD